MTTIQDQYAQVLIIQNPFDIYNRNTTQRLLTHTGQTIREWVDANLGVGWVSWEVPTLCFLNGKKMGRATWETKRLKEGDVLAFSAVPGDPVTIIIAIIAVVVAIAAVLLMPDPTMPTQDGKQADSVFTWKGQDNRLRIGEPIETSYGRCRLWPSYAAPPYNVYRDNQAFTHVLLCLGQGEYTIEDNKFFLEDTDTTSFPEVTIEVIPPGGTITLFKANVITSVEVSSVELYGPNEPNYDGFVGPFIVNPSGTTVTRLEVDVVFPQGLYQMQDNLRFGVSVGYEFEYQEIDDAGAAVGSWTDLSVGSISRRGQSPQRATIGVDVVTGRYHVRGRRTTNKNTGTSVVSTMQWESLKGYSPNTADYGNVTLVAMVARATNNLNATTRSRINCFATRKLPIWNPETETWSALTATRNPIWAFCDIFRAQYGAQLEDTYLDLPTLAALADVADDRGDTYDQTIDQRMSVWEAARLPLRVMRAVPIPQGSLVTAVRDIPRSLPSGVFNQNNIVKGTLVKRLSMFEFQAKDALVIEYTDPDTWKPEEVECVLPDMDGTYKAKLKLPGCTSRAQAYHEGMYILATRIYRRASLVFDTGMEGLNVTYMDLVSVTHDAVRVGQGGFIMAYDTATNVMTLSEEVEFGDGTHYIAIRGTDGAILGEPIAVTAGSQPNKVVLAEDPDETLDFSIDQMPPLFAFGPLDRWAFLGNISKIVPKGEDRVELTVTVYDERVFNFDDDEVPALPDQDYIRDPDAPTVENVIIGNSPDDINTYIVSWKPVDGAQKYLIERSYDGGDTWERVTEVGKNVTSYEFYGLAGELLVRVGVEGQLGQQGQWVVSDLVDLGSTGDTPDAPQLEAVQPAPTDLAFETRWIPEPGATGYTVEVWTDWGGTDVMLRRDVVGLALKYTYTYDMLALDTTDRGRQFDFRVFSTGYGATSATSSDRNAFNILPAVLTGHAVTDMGSGNYKFSWDALGTVPGDFAFYRLMVSNSSGLPDLANVVYEGPLTEFTMPVSQDKYWWVAAYDVWAEDVFDAELGSQQFFDYP